MSRLFKITCISVICFIMLSGCSSREEKVELIETNQLEQSKTDDKTEEKVSESNEEVFLGHCCWQIRCRSHWSYRLRRIK